ncbi:hypothetical protein AVEN_170726-1 [Araneus ventricosus]|uniref:Uncharacterized protein n=1 Tax=Araneus ventricosus TaxID=182803 RepID=A0A4Y2P220_ARAVE|nr:hypothetical protein AVEN_170726-1 [Araneus ventricosus]
MSLTPAEKQKCYRERRRLNAEKEEENRRKDSENKAKCRQNKARKIVATATPCATPDVNLQSSSKKAGRKRVLLNRSKVVRENIQLRNEIKKLKFKTDMYRKRWSRAKLKAEENVTSNSPRSRAKCTLNECFKVQLTPTIWAHLQPILNEFKRISPEVEILHFFSDGPTTQYRQKKIFFLLNKHISDHGLKYGSWSFFEAGHGKGAADGIGGAIKRTADRIVAQGTDIPDAKTLLTVLTNIQLYYINETDVESFKK